MEGLKKTEPDSSQSCPVTGPEIMGTHWKRWNFIWT